MGSVSKFTCLVLACMVMSSSAVYAAEARITCGFVVNKMTPCLEYLRKGGAVPKRCCDGVKGISTAAKTTPDRQAACSCLQKSAKSVHGINQQYASALPKLCGVNLPYDVSPSTDCSKVK